MKTILERKPSGLVVATHFKFDPLYHDDSGDPADGHRQKRAGSAAGTGFIAVASVVGFVLGWLLVAMLMRGCR